MSELNDLIHTNAQRAYEHGAMRERERIIKLLENPYFHNIQSPDTHIECEMCKTVALIGGEQK
jgi:hypothetical protein